MLHHRIGGLESKSPSINLDGLLHHRIGGLEIFNADT